ncbi:hypothetical protein DFQ28_007598 [Apophysomyces sp. BC1034]|nr:hypothetical protein DFQ28_007598 [Apophysomyces sp. BC1034]
MIAVLAVAGFACAGFGARLPGLRHIGGPDFWQSTNILCFFCAAVIVGSLLGMSRAVLIKGIVRFFVPVAVGSVAAAVAGTLTGVAFGMSAFDTFFYIVAPIMAGGIGEGAIPLTFGYAMLLDVPQDQLFARVVPSVVLGNLSAIACAAMLHRISQRHQKVDDGSLLVEENTTTHHAPFSVEQIAAAGMVAISLYLVGLILERFTHLPAPLGMLSLAVVAKLSGAMPAHLEQGAHWIYSFFARAVSYPLLFGIGITLMPWEALLTALTPAHLFTTLVTVLTLIATGFFVGRGMGGIGDLSILTAANRLPLMPFAQLATRIGGALTETYMAIVASPALVIPFDPAFIPVEKRREYLRKLWNADVDPLVFVGIARRLGYALRCHWDAEVGMPVLVHEPSILH